MLQGVFLGNGSTFALKAEEYLNKTGLEIISTQNEHKLFGEFPKQYDIGISFLYPFLIPSQEINKAIWINFHPAPLPNYGGRNIAYHAIINNEEKFGGTIHYMNETFDTGKIIEVKLFKINKSDTAYVIYNKSCDVLLGLLEKYVPLFASRCEITGTEQTNTKYYKQSIIDDFIKISDKLKTEIRAKTYPPFYPKIRIGDKIFKITLENND